MPLTKVTYSMIQGAPLNVADYPTVADANIAASAINKELFFPEGTYNLSADITFNCYVEMASGSKIVTSNKLIFAKGFSAPLSYCLDASGFVQFINVEQIYPQWFGAMGDATYGAGTISSGSTSFTQTIYQPGASQTTLQNGDTIYIYGAGSGGGILSTTVVSGGGTSSLTLANAASTSVTNAAFATRNNTIALQRFFASTISAGPTTPAYGTSLPSTTGSSKLYIPKGIYTSFDTVNCYSCNVVEGDYGYIPTGSAKLVQCNISKPLIKLIADNFDETGASTNGGNGNNVFRYVSFASATIDDTKTNAPVVYFEFPWNVHSDSEFDHCYWTGTAGACVGGGFETTGTINGGSTSLTLGDGSVFRNGNYGGGKIIIKGAGVAGADLSTYIVSGGGTNTVTIANAASTSVTNAVVYPYSQMYDPIKFTTCEMDVCRAGIEFGANAQGQIWVNDLEAFQVIRGAIRITSVGNGFNTVVSNSHFDGCGASYNSESTYRNSIYINNGSATNGGLFVKNSYFAQLVDTGITTGGPIWFEGASLSLTDNNFYNLDTSDLVKFVYTSAANYKIKDNTFTSTLLNSYTNSRIIGFSNSTLPTSWDVSGNVFVNTNATPISTVIQSDYAIEGGKSIDNLFRGAYTNAYDTNIYNLNNTLFPNYGFGPTVKSGSAIPTVGTYVVGSIVWNDLITNAAGQPVGWVCVAGGTPGTWRAFGVTV